MTAVVSSPFCVWEVPPPFHQAAASPAVAVDCCRCRCPAMVLVALPPMMMVVAVAAAAAARRMAAAALLPSF